MTIIAEAFVAVRPDLTGFAGQLREQLNTQTALVGQVHREIKINAVLSAASLRTARQQLAALAKPINVPLQVVVKSPTKASVTSATSIGKTQVAMLVMPELVTAELANIVAAIRATPSEILVTPVLDPAGVSLLREQLAGLRPGIPVGAVTGQPQGVAGAAAVAGAAGAAAVRPSVPAASAGADVAAGAAAARAAAAAADQFLEDADLINLQIEGVNAATTRVAAAETAVGRAILAADKSAATHQKALADHAAALNAESVSDEKTAALYEKVEFAERKAALDAKAVVDKQASLTVARANLDAALAREASTTVGGPSRAATEAANARRAEFAASASGATTTSAASSRALAAGTLIEARAKSELKTITADLRRVEAEYDSVKKESLALSDLALSSDADRTAGRQRDVAAAERQITATRVEINQARELAEANLLGSRVQALKNRAAQTEASLGSVAAIGAANKLKQDAILIDQQLADAEVALGKSTGVASAEARASIASYRAQSAELVRLTTAIDAAAIPQQKLALATAAAARQQGQFQRGLFGGAAGFAGVRGAALAASAPFLIATIGITAIGKALQSTANLEQQLNTFQATASATAEQMNEVGDAARELGGDITLPATSAVDAAVALTELSKAGLDVNQSLAAARGTLELAAAANITAAHAADVSASVLNQYALSGDKAARVTDVLAAASIAAQGSIEDFAQGFKALGAVGHSSGVELEQSAALLTELGKAGLAGADGGTAIRTFLSRLIPQSKEAREAVAKLGVTLDHTKTLGAQLPELIDEFAAGLAKLDPIARKETLDTVFGQRGIRAATILFEQGGGALRQFTQEFEKSGASARLTEARMKGLAGATDALGSSSSTFATTAGSLVTPALTSIVHALTDVVTQATAAAAALQPLTEAGKKIADITPGGGDAIAQIGLVIAAGALLSNQIEKSIVRRQAKAAAAAEAAILEVEAEAEVAAAVDLTTVAVEEQGAVWKASAGGVLLVTEKEILAQRALATQARLTGAALAEEQATAARSGLLGRLGRTGAIGIGAGVAASVAGQAIGGQAGGLLTAAGEGAILGSFLPIPGGTVIGAGVFAAVKLAQQENEKRKSAKQKFQIEWNKMDYFAQWDLVKHDIKIAEFYEKWFDVKMKPVPQSTGLRPEEGILFSGLSNQTVPNFELGPAARTSLNLARASVTPGLADDVKAINARIALDQRNINGLEQELHRGIKNKDRLKVVIANLKSYYSELRSLNDQLVQIITQSPAVAAADLAATKAAGTVTLVDNLAAANAQLEAQQDVLEKLVASGKATAAQLADQREKIAQAQNNVTSEEQAIADQQASAAQTRLQTAAEQAGHVGKAEQALIAFLQTRVAAAKGNAAAIASAEAAVIQEQETARQARENLRKSAQSVIDTRLQNRLARADLTTGTADNKSALKAILASENRQLDALIDAANALAKKGKKGTAEWFAAQQAIAEMGGKIISTKLAIKNLTKGSDSSFSLNDLFKTAIDQFATFGSNISARNGVLSGQDERASFSKSIIDNRSAQIMNSTPEKQLAEAQTTNGLLRELIRNDRLRRDKTGGAPTTGGKGKKGNLLAIYGTEIAAAYNYGVN